MNSSCLPALPARMLRVLAVAATMLSLGEAEAATAMQPPAPATQEIQKRLGAMGDTLKIGNDEVDLGALRAFYQARGWRPAWTDTVDKLTGILASADQEGLPTSAFHLAAIAKRHQANDPQSLAEQDLLLTDALLQYSSAMRGQRADPTQTEDDWFLPTPPFNAVGFLQENSRDLPSALRTLVPPYAGYHLLRQKLADLKAIAAAGDWPKVQPGPTIKPGATDDRIPAIRTRLMATGELAQGDATSPLYDDELFAAVRLFQQRHGLADDGAIGRQSINWMNTSAAQLARQVAVNMERWRWLPPKLEDNHIVVNVPGAWLEVVENGRAMLTMRVVVGDSEHPTPAMHVQMTSLVLNPVWRVPASIATKEILPKLKKDPGYLLANDLELVSDAFPPGSPESQGIGISWNERSSIPWPIRQKAGSDNALGRIKFNMPNNDDIYLHDTPNHKAFTRALRALSHGCVRLEKPDQLALYVLRDKDWSQDKLDSELGNGATRTVSLAKRLPVWLLYWTSWVDAAGNLQLRDDIYGRDLRLSEALGHHQRIAPVNAAQAPMPSRVVRCDGCRVP